MKTLVKLICVLHFRTTHGSVACHQLLFNSSHAHCGAPMHLQITCMHGILIHPFTFIYFRVFLNHPPLIINFNGSDEVIENQIKKIDLKKLTFIVVESIEFDRIYCFFDFHSHRFLIWRNFCLFYYRSIFFFYPNFLANNLTFHSCTILSTKYVKNKIK